MSKRFWVCLTALLFVYACTQDAMPELISLDLELQDLINQAYPGGDNNGMTAYVLPDGSDLTQIPQDAKNPLTEEKVALGKFLFFETGFATNAVNPSGMGTYSCGSCHIPESGFKAGTRQGIADGGVGYGIQGEGRRRSADYVIPDLDVQSARPLSLVNVAFVKNTTWNGRFGAEGENVGTEAYWKESDGTIANELGFESLETQNFEGIEVHRIHITPELIEEFGYKDLFDASFPELPEEDRYSNFAGSLALSAYLRTVISDKAPFQEWLKGNRDAMSIEEKRGAILFFDKANCSNCHYNENLGSGEFHALGVQDIDGKPFFKTTEEELLDRNLGRGSFTGLEEDNFTFKVPGLYNVSDGPHYFHGSGTLTLEEVIDYKNKAQTENSNIPQERLSEKFIPLNLTEEEKTHLLTFLKRSLRDPQLLRYKPEEIKSGFCFPNNDEETRIDLGCN